MQRHFHSRRLSKSFLHTLSCSWGQQRKTGTFLNVKVPQRVSVPSQGLLALRIKRACVRFVYLPWRFHLFCKITDISLCFLLPAALFAFSNDLFKQRWEEPQEKVINAHAHKDGEEKSRGGTAMHLCSSMKNEQ